MLIINERYALGAIPMNIVLYEMHVGKRGKSAGKEVWRESAYFSSPQNALHYLLQAEVKNTELKDLKTVCQKIDDVDRSINSLNISRETLHNVRDTVETSTGRILLPKRKYTRKSK